MSNLWPNGDTGQKSTAGQQSSWQYSLTSNKNFTQPSHPLQQEFRLVSFFWQFCIIAGQQMSTLWANGNRGLISTVGKQSSAHCSLTSKKNFTKPNHPLQEKIYLVCIFSQFSFTPGEHTSTLWRNGDRDLKLTLGQQSSGQHSLASNKNLTQPNHPLPQKFAKSAFFEF